MLAVCERRNDDLALSVKSRLMMIPDLRAPDAVYHAHCHSSFSRSKLYSRAGRPVDAGKQDAFERLCEWLEVTDIEMLTVKELVEKAKGYGDILREDVAREIARDTMIIFS
jgi:hypothetical protein